MGVVTYILGKLIYPFLFMGSATFFAFRLGTELPIASRNAGRAIGMGYNYFKVTIRFFTPESKQANEIISQFRKTSQQAHAFTREFKHSIQKEKKQFQKIVPELGIDPLKPMQSGLNFLITGEKHEQEESVEQKKEREFKQVTGSIIMQDIARERREIIEKKHAKRMQEEHYLKL
ncbi:hypothetical protein FGO68_gene6667 [Halteria grandinella]|uniref:Uncharacterized protein n=1 Tax=Halteria grandinella TaxID=5974 RepID=A0A8J8NF59_HALGN|nr:hypothetical protein FGO68_gene6667 [Halteria grandinella]